MPANSEKAISEATARKEELEKQKVKEEEKLKEVMESLKEETSGLQQDKEVCVCVFFVCFLILHCVQKILSPHLPTFPLLCLSTPDQRERADGAQQGRK